MSTVFSYYCGVKDANTTTIYFKIVHLIRLINQMSKMKGGREGLLPHLKYKIKILNNQNLIHALIRN